MSRPPIKAMKAVKRYCKKRKTCKGCPLNAFDEYGYCTCVSYPEKWIIKKEGDEK